jgi:glycosyltransferase involved in cell wall biosynthesis
MAARRRVLIIGPSLRFLGGQAVQAMRLLEALKEDGAVDVTYLVVDPLLPPPFRALQRVPILRTVVTSAVYILSLLLNVWKYDVLHVFSASYWSFLLAPAPAIVIGRLFRRRVLLNYHSGEADDHLTRWGWHAKPILRMAQTVVVPTDYLVEVFARHGFQAAAIPNHVATESRLARRRQRPIPRFFSNRNFERHYNVRAVIDAFAIIRKTLPEAELVLTGGGSQRGALESQVHERGLEAACRFTGPVPPVEMKQLYTDADIYVNASLIDNMPLSILEAYSVGVPVVTSDAGGIPWIAIDGVTALVVPANDVGALASAMAVAVDKYSEALDRASAARRYVEERFSWTAVRYKWQQLYGVS